MARESSEGRIVQFHKDIENRLIALILRRDSFYVRVKHLISPEYFRKEVQKLILASVNLRKKGHQFDRQMLAHESGMGQSFVDYFYRINIKTAVDDYYAKVFVDFVQAFEFEKFILESAVLLENRAAGDETISFSSLKRQVSEILQIEAFDDFGIDHFETAAERVRKGMKELKHQKVPTGIPTYDKILNGGLGRGEMGIILAPTGRGKSFVLCNFVHSAVLNGFHCIHQTLEMPGRQVQLRYDCRASGMDQNTFFKNRKKAYALIKKVQQIRNGKLVVQDLREKRPTVANISSMLYAYVEKFRRPPDVIAIDYPDLLRPSTRYSEKRIWVGEIYEDIRLDVLAQFNMAGWMISQSNRLAWREDIVDLDSSAEDFSKMQTADVVAALCQTADEKKKGVMRLHNAKDRDGSSGEIIRLQTDFSKALVQES